MPVDMKKYFINPYNFVRYSQKKKAKSTAMGDDRKRGVISCGLKVGTPLSIPDTAEKKANYLKNEGHNAYPFFSIDGKPVIPGSELRGLIRNVYETITDSCFSVINNNTLTARTSSVNAPGILYFDDQADRWVLQSADKKSAYTETTKKILDEKYKNYPGAVIRDWPLSVQLSTNMQRLKNIIDKSLKSAKSYKEFEECLQNNKGKKKDDPILRFQVSEKNDEKSDAYIFSSKMSSKEEDNKMNSVKIAKKWGEQYSDKKIREYFEKDEEDRKEYHEKYYSDKIINHSVFIPLKQAKDEEIDSEALEAAVEELNLILDLYYEYSNRNEALKSLLDAVRPSTSGRSVPVFYRRDGNRILLAPAQMSREIYNKKIHDFLGSHAKCATENDLCPACSLFGIVSENNMAVSSRIRFSDAQAVKCTRTDDYLPLKILSSPKTTACEFYATGKYSGPDTMLRGRKFYLHDPEAKTSEKPYRQPSGKETKDKSRKERSDLNASVQLVTDGTFEFKIYFDGISEKELKNLILALDLGENIEDGMYMHKLGHGKPLGLGSVKIWVKEVKFRTIVDNTYTLESNGEFDRFLASLSTGSIDGNPLAVKAGIAEGQKGVQTDYIFADKETLCDLLYICDFKHFENFIVSYPIITGGGNVNDTASHRFFSWIRDASVVGKKKKGKSPRSEEGQKYKALPGVSESADEMKLPILTLRDKKVVAVDDTLNATPSDTNEEDKKDTPEKQADDQARKVKCTRCNKLFTPSPSYRGNDPCCPECFKKGKGAWGVSGKK